MSCSGYFDTLLRKTEQQSFNKRVLEEIEELTDRLQRKLESLTVQGDFHRANKVKAKLDYLEKTEKRIKQLLRLPNV